MDDMVERVEHAICNSEGDGCEDTCIQREFGKQCAYNADALVVMPLCDALAKIARGGEDGGSPLGGEKARQLARGAMIELGLDW